MGVSRLKTIIIVMDFIRSCIFPNGIYALPTYIQENTLSREMNHSLQWSNEFHRCSRRYSTSSGELTCDCFFTIRIVQWLIKNG